MNKSTGKNSGHPSEKQRKSSAKAGKGKHLGWIDKVLERIDQVDDIPPVLAKKLEALPDWVKNILVEFMKFNLPGVKWKKGMQFDEAMVGAFLGKFYGFARLLKGEVLLGPKTEEELGKVPKKVPAVKVDKSLQKAVEEGFSIDMKAAEELAGFASSVAIKQPHGEALAFNKAFNRGADIKPDDYATAYTMTRRMNIYFWLFFGRPVVEHCKSLREVYNWLCKQVGSNKVGNFKRFEKVCAQIGLKLRGRGRPAKGK